jgi:hypothetical protein
LTAPGGMGGLRGRLTRSSDATSVIPP